MNLPMPLLCLDPSSTTIGWALLGPGPSYITSGSMSLPAAPPDERVRMAGDAVGQIIKHCRYRPSLVLIEMPDYIASWATTSIILYFRAVGVVEYAVHLRGLPIRYEKASKLKENLGKQQAKDRFRAITGRYPTRTTSQMQRASDGITLRRQRRPRVQQPLRSHWWVLPPSPLGLREGRWISSSSAGERPTG